MELTIVEGNCGHKYRMQYELIGRRFTGARPRTATNPTGCRSLPRGIAEEIRIAEAQLNFADQRPVPLLKLSGVPEQLQ